MTLKLSSLNAITIYCGRSRPLVVSLSDGTEITYKVTDCLDWNWFSDNGFLDTTSTEDAWNWIKPIESVNVYSDIGEFAFDDCQTLLNVSLSENVKSIGESAFYKCFNLQSISGLDNVVSLGDWAFDRCLVLELDHLPPNLVEMGKGAFANCERLVGEIAIPMGITEIGEQTFVNCTGLEKVTIHPGVASIGENAFEGCTSLNRIVF